MGRFNCSMWYQILRAQQLCTLRGSKNAITYLGHTHTQGMSATGKTHHLAAELICLFALNILFV